jgi:hypothetical protein
MKLASARTFHLLANFIHVRVGIQLRKACNVYLHTGHYFAHEWPLSAVLIPTESVKILNIYSCCVCGWLVFQYVAVHFGVGGRWMIVHCVQFVEY